MPTVQPRVVSVSKTGKSLLPIRRLSSRAPTRVRCWFDWSGCLPSHSAKRVKLILTWIFCSFGHFSSSSSRTMKKNSLPSSICSVVRLEQSLPPRLPLRPRIDRNRTTISKTRWHRKRLLFSSHRGKTSAKDDNPPFADYAFSFVFASRSSWSSDPRSSASLTCRAFLFVYSLIYRSCSSFPNRIHKVRFVSVERPFGIVSSSSLLWKSDRRRRKKRAKKKTSKKKMSVF